MYSNCIISRAACLLRNKMKITWALQKWLWPTMQVNWIWKATVLRLSQVSEKSLWTTIQPQQLTNKENSPIFFSITHSHATSQSRDTQVGSQPQHSKHVAIDQAIVFFHADRQYPLGPRSQHACHRQKNAIITRHQRCFPLLWRPLHLEPSHFGEVEVSIHVGNVQWLVNEILQYP